MEKFIQAKTVRELVAKTPAEFMDLPISFHNQDGQWTEGFQVRFSADHQQTVFELEFSDEEQVFITEGEAT